jgi:glycosylphosphatidylinositol transamidase (GPIT) subunit GPI8
MSLRLFDLSPEILFRLGATAAILVLLLLLVASFASRSRVFCQYLRHMTGIDLKPRRVRRLYRELGQAGVRDMLISLLIQQDLADTSRVVTPDSKPDTSVFDADDIVR